jgi:hypothetical protein
LTLICCYKLNLGINSIHFVKSLSCSLFYIKKLNYFISRDTKVILVLVTYSSQHLSFNITKFFTNTKRIKLTTIQFVEKLNLISILSSWLDIKNTVVFTGSQSAHTRTDKVKFCSYFLFFMVTTLETISFILSIISQA